MQLKNGEMLTFTREVRIAEKILLVDGISGSGKSLLFPILSSFKRVEVQRIEHIYEYLCLVHHFKKIETDAAISLIRIYADLAVHDTMISRQANFRPKDDSSVFNTPHPLRYLGRLFLSDGPTVLDRVREEKPILHIMTHQLLGCSRLAFLAFGERLRFIEMLRHPLYVLDNWQQGRWGERYGTDPKDLTLWLKYDGRAVPWWACGWEGQYLQLSPLARAVHSIHAITHQAQETYDRFDEGQKRHVLFIPFEQFATDPWPFIRELAVFLGTEVGSRTHKMLKKQRCPRSFPLGMLDTLREKYLKEITEHHTAGLLVQLCEQYEARYGTIA